MEILISFGVGILASAIVGYGIYRKQRLDASVSEQRLVFLMEQALKKALHSPEGLQSTIAAALHATVARGAEEHRTERPTSGAQHVQLSISEALSELAESMQPPPSPLRRHPRHLARLSENSLENLHRLLMPPGPIAGKIRESMIEIAGSSHTPPAPDELPGRLEELLTSWNSGVADLPAISRDEQVKRLAAFHHAFLSIHPFYDGNGAVARALLSSQLRALFGNTRPVLFEDRERYYRALTLGDAGDLSELETLVGELAATANHPRRTSR